MMNENRFTILADAGLTHLFETIDSAAGDDLDVDKNEGLLTIELEGGGQYVINKHAPNCQIWLSSPVSGAHHFDYDETAGGWVDTRAVSRGAMASESMLEVILSSELSAVLGREIDLGAIPPAMPPETGAA